MLSSPRAVFDWSISTRTLQLGRRTLIMGIVNVTPDSFSDGGRYAAPEDALRRSLDMLEEGADILDLGGESTRPNSTPLASTDEQRRVLPVLEAILKQRSDAVISIDTYHADTARLAVQAGAQIVNDVSGHLWDPQMATTCAELACGVVLMHTRGRPAEWMQQPPLSPAEVLPLVMHGLRQQAQRATQAGVGASRIVLDPGFGFGKIRQENYPLLAGFSQLSSLGFPLLAGLSRKSFLKRKESTNVSPAHADASVLASTLAANTLAILAGAHIVRVHDVAKARAAADFADLILNASREN